MSDKCLDLPFDPHRSQSIMEVVAIIMRFFFFFNFLFIFKYVPSIFLLFYIYIFRACSRVVLIWP